MFESYKIKICPHCKTNVTNVLKDGEFDSLLDHTCPVCGKTFSKSRYDQWDETPGLYNNKEIKITRLIFLVAIILALLAILYTLFFE